MKYLLIGLIIFSPFLFSCTKKSSDHVKVKIQFDSRAFDNSKGQLAKANNDEGPNWGLSDPKELSDIDCWAIFVGGPEETMSHSYCENGGGKVIARFGPRAGFYPIDHAGEVTLPKGKNRQFFLAGMGSTDGTCQKGFAENANLEFNRYSAPFVIATTMADILKNGQKISLPLKNDFNNSNRIEDCNFIDDRANLKVDLFHSNREVWISDNPIPRTVTFTYDEGTAYCSRDNANFAACTTPKSFIWQWADRTNKHVIRIQDDQGKVLDSFRFTPEIDYSTVNPVTCDLNVVMGDTFGSIASSLLGTGNVICFSDGVIISEPSAALGIGSENYLVVRYGETATIENTSASNSTFIIASGDDSNHFYGLKIVGAVTNTATVSITDADATKFVDVEVLNNGGGDALRVYTASANTTTEIMSSQMRAMGATGKGVYGYSSTAALDVSIHISDHSILEGTSSGFYSGSSSKFYIQNSKIEGVGTASRPFGLRETSYAHLMDSEIVDNNGWGSNMHCNFASVPVHLELDGNVFKRNNITGSTNGPALTFSDCGGGDGPIEISSAANDNIFCNVDSGTASFSQILATSAALLPGMAFNPTENNNGNGDAGIATCAP